MDEPEREAYSRSPSPQNSDHSGGEARDEDGRIVSENEEGAAQRDPNSEDEEEKKKKKKKSNKPKGPVRRQLISEDMLGGRNGLTKVQEIFKDFEFRGKRREKEDLDRILNKMEQWIHALHPKHPFDQCLERIEFLGIKKKPVKTLLKKMRMGLISPEDNDERRDIIDDDDDSNPFPAEEPETSVPNADVHDFGSDDDLDTGMLDELEQGVISSSNQNNLRQSIVIDSNLEGPTFDELLEYEQQQALAEQQMPEPEEIEDHMDVDMDLENGSVNNQRIEKETNYLGNGVE